MTTTPHDLAKLNCDQLRGRLDSLRPDIDRNGPETLRELLAQVDALLARQTGWSACKRAARYRNILDIYYASRSALPVLVGSGNESVPPLDLVVPLGDGSMHDDLELRFLLRSAVSCLPRLRRVHIIGPRRPEWLREHDRLRFHAWSQTRPKNHDIVAKFIHAAHHPAVSETFVGTCDDFLFLSRCPADYGAVATRGVLSTSRDRGAWKRAQADTRKVLEQAGLPVVYYDYHVPTVMTKSGWRKVNASVQWKSVPGHAVWSLYHNTAGVHGEVRSGTYASYHAADGSKTPQSMEEIERDTTDKLFLCYNDGGLKNGVLEGWLATRFPTPAPWEGDSPRSHEEHEERQEANWEGENGEGESGKVDLPAGVGLGESGQSGASSSRYPDDLDILVVLYGRNPHRAQAVAKTFANWHKYQRPMPRVLCAWCYRDGEAPGELATIPDHPWLQRVPLPQYDLDDGVFRKEGLLNHLLKEHATAPYILTLDADVWSPRNGWLQSIRDKLAENPDHVLQPFMYFRDTKEKTGAWSWSAQTLDGVDPKRCKHPGLGWAFTRAWADKHGDQPVFNPWHITGSGDWMFVYEHFPSCRRGHFSVRRIPLCLQRTGRRVPACVLSGVGARLWHENHTDLGSVPDPYRNSVFADRAYKWSRLALDCWGAISQYIVLDALGVPVLRDPEGPYASFIARKPEMQSKEATDRVIAESLLTMPRSRLPNGDQITLETLPGIGDHLMLLGVVNHLRYTRPQTKISVRLTRPGLESWFESICPGIQFTDRKGTVLRWRHLTPSVGRHVVSVYGASEEDIVLPRPVNARRNGALRIAFVGEHNVHLPLKTWPHWGRLSDLVRERYGVEPIMVGTEARADPVDTLPELLASMDAVVCTEGMASHLCWAIRKRAVVLVTGAVDPSALAYPGWHTIVQGTCPYGRFCRRYTDVTKGPDCSGECMDDIRPESVLESIRPTRRILNVHFLSSNCGDANCGPARYFPGIVERPSTADPIRADTVIFGGGGVYQASMHQLARRYRELGARIVIWGAGIVTEDRANGMTPWSSPEFGEFADLCALREPSPWRLVPCPSCMSPLFDLLRDVTPEHQTVYYNHPDKPVRAGAPRMTNYQTVDMETVLRFLASGRRVVTSSYHGRIWATWLGRDVELDGPAAEELSKSGPVPPLHTAREMNREFYAEAMGIL